MAEAIVPQERLLYASYSPPHLYDDGTDDGQPLVTALFREPTNGGGNEILHPRILAGQGAYVLPLSQKRRPLEPGGDKARVVQGDRNALAGLSLRGCKQRFMRELISPHGHQNGGLDGVHNR